ncbi:hypothetical protein MMC13_004672 [Lambiella insularis]|nr:hypothetical protein [Lambiella insularis]
MANSQPPLPSEIWALIFRELKRSDLKSVRLLCTSFAKATVPLLFTTAYVSLREKPTAVSLQLLANPVLSPHIHRLIVDCQHLRVANLDADDEALALKYPVVQVWQHENAHRWREISRRDEVHADELGEVMQLRLEAIVPLISRLQTVIFDASSQEPASWDPDWAYLTAKYRCQDLQALDNWRPSPFSHLCFEAVCQTFASHQVFPSQWLCAGISHQYPNCSTYVDVTKFEEFQSLLVARGITEHSEKASLAFPKVLKNIKILELSIGLDGLNLNDEMILPLFLKEGKLPLILQRSEQLEELYLRFSQPWPPWFMATGSNGGWYDGNCIILEQHLLGRHTWTKLRALTVEGCSVQGGDLIDLVERHHSTLQTLDLRHTWLRPHSSLHRTYPKSTWAQWLDELRLCVGKERARTLGVSMHQVYDWKTCPQQAYSLEDADVYSLTADELGAFLVYGGLNPFLLSGRVSNPFLSITGDNVDT